MSSTVQRGNYKYEKFRIFLLHFNDDNTYVIFFCTSVPVVQFYNTSLYVFYYMFQDSYDFLGLLK